MDAAALEGLARRRFRDGEPAEAPRWCKGGGDGVSWESMMLRRAGGGAADGGDVAKRCNGVDGRRDGDGRGDGVYWLHGLRIGELCGVPAT